MLLLLTSLLFFVVGVLQRNSGRDCQSGLIPMIGHTATLCNEQRDQPRNMPLSWCGRKAYSLEMRHLMFLPVEMGVFW